MTVAECCAAAKPALFVPYPFSAGEHQDFNAQVLVDAGAAKVVSNDDLHNGKMLKVLRELLADPVELAKMGKRAAHLHKVDDLPSVVQICKDMCDA